MITRYYFLMDDNGKSYGVFRWRQLPGELYLEAWDGKDWIDWPGLYAVTGMGGHTAYELTNEEEALAFMKSHTLK